MKKVLAFLFAIIVFAGCEDTSTQDCSTRATVRDLNGLDGCGWVFELEDGTHLEPLRFFYCGTPPLPKEVTEDPLYNFEFVDGKPVLINYEPLDGYASICMVGPIVRITCLTEVALSISEE